MINQININENATLKDVKDFLNCFPKKIKCFSGKLSGTEKEINQDIDPNIKCVLLFLVDYIEKLEKEISSKNR